MGQTMRRGASLEGRISTAFEQAMADGRSDLAEHLLRALEALASARTPDPTLDRAYLLIAQPEARKRLARR